MEDLQYIGTLNCFLALRHPIVFFFNPDIQLEQFIDNYEVGYCVGYRVKRHGEWVSLDFKL